MQHFASVTCIVHSDLEFLQKNYFTVNAEKKNQNHKTAEEAHKKTTCALSLLQSLPD